MKEEESQEETEGCSGPTPVPHVAECGQPRVPHGDCRMCRQAHRGGCAPLLHQLYQGEQTLSV